MMNNPIQIVVDLSMDYFRDNQDSQSYQLSKAVIGDKLDVGINKQGVICKTLVNDYAFIQDSKGFLIIDRKGFEEWLTDLQEKQEQEERQKELYKRDSAASKAKEEIDKHMAELDKLISEKESQVVIKAAIVEKKEKEVGDLGAEVSGLDSKLADLQAKESEIRSKKSAILSEIDKITHNSEISHGYTDWLGQWILMTKLNFSELLNVVKTEQEPMKKLYKIYQENRPKEPNYKLRAFLLLVAVLLLILGLWASGFFGWIYSSIVGIAQFFGSMFQAKPEIIENIANSTI